MYYFISDTHFGHFNIIKYCHRPFDNAKEMEDAIVKKWNEKVKPEDTVFFLGDFCMKKSSEAPEGKTFDYYKGRLNGKIIFFKGNHDKNNGNKSIIESMVIKHGGSRIYMTHDPKFAKEDFKYNFCGHVHEKWQFRKIGKRSVIINLSVEQWNYQPVDINEIFSALSKWKRSHKKC